MRSIIFLFFLVFCSSALAEPQCSAPTATPASGLFPDQAAAYAAAESNLQYQLCMTDYANTGRVKMGDRQYVVVLDHPSAVVGVYSYITSCSEKQNDVYNFSDNYYSNFNNGTRSCFVGWKPSSDTSACEVVMHADPVTHRIIAVHTGRVCDVFNYEHDCLSLPGYSYKEGGSGNGVSMVEGYGDCVPAKPQCSSD
ncbi:MAG TPA: virulence factor TspB C-terminal domain-related protein, partial [Xylella fastidiosa subsp. multiplex]